mmetsp:Transcript_25151/g.24614  ORF Transcript_25151/g.24614 Transcript_25151/m.24614 type:complete len:84 (+) Transcript_25151:159-410(+)
MDLIFEPVNIEQYRVEGADFKVPECPKGYEYGLSALFPGLVEGCNCIDQKTGFFIKEFPEVRTGKCNYNETEAGCFTVDRIKE